MTSGCLFLNAIYVELSSNRRVIFNARINRALLGNELVECGGLFLRPGSGEMIQIMIADRRFLFCLTPRRFFQQLDDRLIHADFLLLGPLLDCTGDFGRKVP